MESKHYVFNHSTRIDQTVPHSQLAGSRIRFPLHRDKTAYSRFSDAM